MDLHLIQNLFIILAVGLISGVVAKRFGFSMLVGYLLAGVVIGKGGFGLVDGDAEEISHLAHAGALLLLFAIGIEFSLEELVKLRRYFFVGGSLQMILAAVPVAVVCLLLDASWRTALLIAAATALSSTVLVFRALAEWGETATPQGRRAISILLFQDVALVPLMLLVPLLVGGECASASAYLFLALNSVLFIAAVLVLRHVFARWLVPFLASLRSVELVILFGLIVLVGFCMGANAAGLPPALGAFAAGLALSGNRLTGQVDALILPYRESFGVVLFVSLGTLLEPSVLIEEPLLLIGGLLGVLAVKTGGAALAMRAVGSPWRAAAGMGLGLAQVGEFAFVLLSAGEQNEVISEVDYNRMLFIAIGTLILTPQLLKLGLGWMRRLPWEEYEAEEKGGRATEAPREAIVIGLGPIGRRASSQLEIMGIDVCLVDLSPVNLHAYAQQGFRTISGDAADPEVLERADAPHSRLAVVCVPDDQVASQIVKAIARINPTCNIIVRCRYQGNAAGMKKAGASAVVSEEAEASVAVMRLLAEMEKR